MKDQLEAFIIYCLYLMSLDALTYREDRTSGFVSFCSDSRWTELELELVLVLVCNLAQRPCAEVWS